MRVGAFLGMAWARHGHSTGTGMAQAQHGHGTGTATTLSRLQSPGRCPKAGLSPFAAPSTVLTPCLFSSPDRSNSRQSRSKVSAGTTSPSDGIRHGEPPLQIFLQQEMGKEAGEEGTRSWLRDVAGIETPGSSEQPLAPCSALGAPQMNGIIPASQPSKEKGVFCSRGEMQPGAQSGVCTAGAAFGTQRQPRA